MNSMTATTISYQTDNRGSRPDVCEAIKPLPVLEETSQSQSKCHRLGDKYYHCLERNVGDEVICSYWLKSWEMCQLLCKRGHGKCELFLKEIAK